MTKLALGIAPLLLVAAATTFAETPSLPPGVVNTQDPKDHPLSPQAALQKITVPEGFQVTLFAGEPDVMQPVAFDFDDRGRLWVVENYSYRSEERRVGKECRSRWS